MASGTLITTDHDVIRNWVTARDAMPARVPASEASGVGGVLRLDFTGGAPTEAIEHCGWDAWFQIFDAEGLALEIRDSDYADDVDEWFAFVKRS